jgi:hypothetical protein
VQISLSPISTGMKFDKPDSFSTYRKEKKYDETQGRNMKWFRRIFILQETIYKMFIPNTQGQSTQLRTLKVQCSLILLIIFKNELLNYYVI